MDIIKLYQDHGITYAEGGEHTHVTDGWVGVNCPFCGGDKYHLGYKLEGNYFFCWRCGWHPTIETLSRLLDADELKVRQLIKEYGSTSTVRIRQPAFVMRTKPFQLPSQTMPLQKNHKTYLAGRGFDPDYLESLWHLIGTGPYSTLDNTDYRHRIIIPYLWDNQMVSFDSRSITDFDKSKYKACPGDREIIPHKHILYGLQEYWKKDMGICVEGPADVWRMGPASFATCGIQFTPLQVRTISKYFNRVFIIYDNEILANTQALKLQSELEFRGIHTEIISLADFGVKDPADLTQSEADYIIKELIEP